MSSLNNKKIKYFIYLFLLIISGFSLFEYWKTKYIYSIEDFDSSFNNSRLKYGMQLITEDSQIEHLFDYEFLVTYPECDNKLKKFITVRRGMIGGETDCYFINDSTLLLIKMNYTLIKKINYCVVNYYPIIEYKKNNRQNLCTSIPKDSARILIEEFNKDNKVCLSNHL